MSVKEIPIDNFHQVTPHLFRSAQPILEHYEHLAKCSITTVINLRGEISSDAVKKIEQHLDTLSIKHLHIPLMTSPPQRSVMENLVEVVKEAERNEEGVLVHCAFGRDRTGFFVGTWRILAQGWDYDTTYAEMVKNGFYTGFTDFTDALKNWSLKV